MKRFYTATDIENLAASGKNALVLGPKDFLTPLARDRANDLGVQLRPAVTPQPATAPQPQSPPQKPRTQPQKQEQVSKSGTNALTIFIELLHQARDEAAGDPQLTHYFEGLLLAVERKEPVAPTTDIERAGLTLHQHPTLAEKVARMNSLARRLFGPESPQRRFDILWTLAALEKEQHG